MFVTTVTGQKTSFSRRDVGRAEAARKLQQIIKYPSDKDYINMIDYNLINNCNTTSRDISLANEIYGVDPNVVKGKSTRRQPVYQVPPAILRNYTMITLVIDIYHINGAKFLQSISRRFWVQYHSYKASTLCRLTVSRRIGSSFLPLAESQGTEVVGGNKK